MRIPARKKENSCKICGRPILPNSTYCTECWKKVERTVNRPSREELKKLIRTVPFIRIAEQYNVTDNAVRKWCVVEHLPSRKKDIRQYSDEEWKNI